MEGRLLCSLTRIGNIFHLSQPSIIGLTCWESVPIPLSVIRVRNLRLVSPGAQTALFQGRDCKVAPFPASQANQMHTRSLRVFLETLNFWPNKVWPSATYSHSWGHVNPTCNSTIHYDERHPVTACGPEGSWHPGELLQSFLLSD